jgi:hypothetical protein
VYGAYKACGGVLVEAAAHCWEVSVSKYLVLEAHFTMLLLPYCQVPVLPG